MQAHDIGIAVTQWQPQSAVATTYIVHEPFFCFTSRRTMATPLVFHKPLMYL